MKRIFLLLISFYLFPLIINAETYTYEICKNGCEYSTLEEIENDMKSKTDKETVIIEFKDSETYEYTAEESFNINHNIKEYKDIKYFELQGNNATIKATKYLELGDFENILIDNITFDSSNIRVARNKKASINNAIFNSSASIFGYAYSSNDSSHPEAIDKNLITVSNCKFFSSVFFWLSTFYINNNEFLKLASSYNAITYYNNNSFKNIASGSLFYFNSKIYVYSNNIVPKTPMRVNTKGLNYNEITSYTNNDETFIEYAINSTNLNQGYTQENYLYYYQDIDKTISANTNISDFEKEFINTYENSIGYDDIKDLPIEWKSENESIAKIENGVIIPVNAGKVDLEGTRGNDIYTIHLTVSPEEGTIEKKETSTENFGEADFNVDNLDSIIPLTEDEQIAKDTGKNIDVFLDVKDITETVDNNDKLLINEKISTNETLAMYLDISLFKQVEGEEPNKIEETKGNIKVSFKIPGNLKNSNPSIIRKYYILRLHNGVVDKLETNLNGDILSFETNKFSTYALIYEDVDNPKTGDNIVIYLILGFLSLIFIPVLIKKTK